MIHIEHCASVCFILVTDCFSSATFRLEAVNKGTSQLEILPLGSDCGSDSRLRPMS